MIKIDLKFDLEKNKERKIHLVCFQGLLRKCFWSFLHIWMFLKMIFLS